MSNDHFVARTYLKHFGDQKARGMLHAYRKTDGKEFPCWPKDVCHEWEGDLNDAFPDNPGMLGDYRKIFEPLWNPAVQTILEGSIGREEKFIVSAYMANLMVCTPAWRRIGQKIYRDGHVGVLKFKQEMAEKHGKPDPILKEGLEMLDQGHIEIEVDPGYIKAKSIRGLMDFACTIYDQDWTIVTNTTDQPFVTSDNPVAISYSGRPGEPLTRDLGAVGHRLQFGPDDVVGDAAHPGRGVEKAAPESQAMMRCGRRPGAGRERAQATLPGGQTSLSVSGAHVNRRRQ